MRALAVMTLMSLVVIGLLGLFGQLDRLRTEPPPAVATASVDRRVFVHVLDTDRAQDCTCVERARR